MKIAIIGSGISGLGAAYLLNSSHHITVYEKNAYIGGHTRTITVPTGATETPVDTGFIVFNDRNYPNLTGLFKTLAVPYQKSDMSFGVSIDNGWLEYGSEGLFAQKRNYLRPNFYRMLIDILRFNKKALSYVGDNTDMTLQECLDHLNMGSWFRHYYLLAMGAAIWSCPVETITQFPARTFLQFFNNHGLLSLNNRPQWYTVTGGAQQYVKRLTASFRDNIKLNCHVENVRAQSNTLVVKDSNGDTDRFDQVIFACHADEALAILDNPTPYQDVLGAFTYQRNHIIVHGDTRFMPREKPCWASWVYLSEHGETPNPNVSLSYWMNNLQKIDPAYPVIVTLNPGRRPAPHLIFDEHHFSHPIFDRNAIQSQQKIQHIQGKHNVWFCGAYQRYGFHEDGLLSAVNIAKTLGVDIPWQ